MILARGIAGPESGMWVPAGLAAVLIVAATQAVAESDAVRGCLDRPANLEQRECAEQLFRTASADLAAALARAIESVSKSDRREPADPESWAAAARESQERWQAYRDAECWRVVGYGRGSGRMTWIWGCLAEKTLERIRELRTPFYQR